MSIAVSLAFARFVIIIVTICFMEAYCQSFTQFNENHAVIVFSPLYDPNVKTVPINLEAVIKMVAVIATRFKKIFMISLKYDEYDSPKMYIPMAVARYNRDYRNKSTFPLELLMHYKTDTDEISRNNLTVSKILFTTVLNLADEANAVFPGSVHSIYYAAPFSDVDLVERNLVYAEQEVAQSPNSYKLGVTMSASYATTLSWHIKQNKWPAISRLENFLLQFALGDVADPPQPETIFEDNTLRFAGMQKILQESKKQVNKSSAANVSLLVAYPGVPGNRDASLVTSWQLYNNWTRETNNTVVLHEAFDAIRKDHWIGRGWWRLVPNITFSSAEDYEFEEKQIVMKSPHIFDRSSEGAGSAIQITNQAVYIGTAVLTSLFVVLAVWIYFYKRIQSRVFQASNVICQNELDHYLGENNVAVENNSKTKNKMCLGQARKLEMAEDLFSLEELCIIGSGSFGVVCSGKILLNDVWLEVAVKLTKENCSKMQTLGLLNEIRLLSYLGKHENIIEILGVYTGNALKGKVLAFLELCPNGSLHSWLKRKNPRSEMNENNDQCTVLEQKRKKITPDLLHWSIDIARGMQFLASKKVVHGDLATRNILLGREMKAVICDFGLSCHLDDDKKFVEANNQKLSWRWASPELIAGEEMPQEKSDVWSYGVTLWEIFSLGELPFPDVSNGQELLLQLKHGRKLSEPLYCSGNLYAEVIEKCLSLCPVERPSFQELFGFMHKIAVTYDTVV